MNSRSFITFVLMASHLSMIISKSSDVTELVDKCSVDYNYTSPSQSNVSLTFKETKKSVTKLVSGKLCSSPSGNVSCQVKVEILLANCSNCSNTQKPTVHCEFNSIQIISFDNKTIDLNGIISVNTNITVNLERLNFVINSEYLLETLNFTKNGENLKNLTSEIVKFINCSLVNIEETAATTTTTKKPTTKNDVTKKPKTKKPTNKNDVTKKPTTNEPTTKKPTTKKPTTKKPVKKTKSKSSNGKIALVILAIFILMGVGIIACYFKYRKKLSNGPAYYNDISLNDPLHTEIKFYKADGEDGEDNAEEDDDDDVLPLI